jgi:hypothetical protein
MTRIRMILLSLFAVFAISAVASASASAANKVVWIEGAALGVGGTAELSGIEKTNESRIKFGGGAIEIKCPQISLLNRKSPPEETEESGTAKSETFFEGIAGPETVITKLVIQFSDCVVLKPTTKPCEVEDATGTFKDLGDITTVAIKVKVNVVTGAVEFAPEAGTTFASFKLVGTGCGVTKGLKVVKGTTKGTINEPESCKALHTLSITEANGTLLVGETPAELFEQGIELGIDEGGTVGKSDGCWDIK